MTHASRLTCLLLLTLLFAAGCDANLDGPLAEEPQARSGASRACPLEKEMALEEAVRQHFCDFSIITDLIIFSRKDWRTVDADVRAYLVEREGEERISKLKKMASSIMLPHLLRVPDASRARVEAVAFYTELLVENEGAHYDEIYMGLTELQGHWSAARLRQTAETVLAYGEAHEEERLAAIAEVQKATWDQYGDGLAVPVPNPWSIEEVRKTYASNGLKGIKAFLSEQ